MKKYDLLIALVAFLFLFSACEKDTPSKADETPLFPLDTDNSWTYEQTSFNGGKPEVRTYNTEPKYFYTIDGYEGYSLGEYVKGEPISLINNDTEGNCIEYLFNNDKLVHQTILHKKDLKKGEKWTYKAAVYTNDDYSKYSIEEREKTCIATDTIISTPKGDFSCVGISYHPGGFAKDGTPNHTMVQFLSENVGIVKHMHYEHANGDTWLFSESVIVDYSLKK